jgi:hypothetical protein
MPRRDVPTPRAGRTRHPSLRGSLRVPARASGTPSPRSTPDRLGGRRAVGMRGFLFQPGSLFQRGDRCLGPLGGPGGAAGAARHDNPAAELPRRFDCEPPGARTAAPAARSGSLPAGAQGQPARLAARTRWGQPDGAARLARRFARAGAVPPPTARSTRSAEAAAGVTTSPGLRRLRQRGAHPLGPHQHRARVAADAGRPLPHELEGSGAHQHLQRGMAAQVVRQPRELPRHLVPPIRPARLPGEPLVHPAARGRREVALRLGGGVEAGFEGPAFDPRSRNPGRGLRPIRLPQEASVAPSGVGFHRHRRPVGGDPGRARDLPAAPGAGRGCAHRQASSRVGESRSSGRSPPAPRRAARWVAAAWRGRAAPA